MEEELYKIELKTKDVIEKSDHLKAKINHIKQRI